MNITITLRLELPDALTAALNALAASLATRPASLQPPSPGSHAPARTRPAGGLPASDVSSLTLPAAKPASPPVFFTGDHSSAHPNRRTYNKWTPERIAIMRRDWPAGRCARAITDEINSLAGETVNPTQVGIYAAGRLYLRRPANFNPHQPLSSGPAYQASQRAPAIPDRRHLPAAMDGKIYASWAEITAFAQGHGRDDFNGDMMPVQALARRLGVQGDIILTEPFGPGSTASALPAETAGAQA